MEEKVRRVTDYFQEGGDQAPEGALQCESEEVVTRCPGNDEPRYVDLKLKSFIGRVK